MLVTLNGERVLSCVVEMPLRGRWRFVAQVDAQVIAEGAVKLEAPGLTLLGATRPGRLGIFRDVAFFACTAAPGLGDELPAQGYRSAPVSVVLGDILRDAKETLAASADATLLSTGMPWWDRAGGTGGRQIADLAEQLGFQWRALDDGKVWIGIDAWPEAKAFDHQVIEDDPQRAFAIIASDTAELRPGVVFNGRKVVFVKHRFEGGTFRTEVTFALVDSAPKERSVFAALKDLARLAVKELGQLGRHAARVVGQSSNGGLEVVTDDVKRNNQVAVPIRYGIPGVTSCKVPNAARCAVGYEDGDPRKPVIVGFEAGGCTELVLFGGTKGVARKDDMCEAGTLSIASVDAGPSRIITFTYTPPATTPPTIPTVWTLTFAVASAPVLAPLPVTVTLKAKIKDGSAILKVG